MIPCGAESDPAAALSALIIVSFGGFVKVFFFPQKSKAAHFRHFLKI